MVPYKDGLVSEAAARILRSGFADFIHNYTIEIPDSFGEFLAAGSTAGDPDHVGVIEIDLAQFGDVWSSLRSIRSAHSST